MVKVVEEPVCYKRQLSTDVVVKLAKSKVLFLCLMNVTLKSLSMPQPSQTVSLASHGAEICYSHVAKHSIKVMLKCTLLHPYG